MYEELVAKYSKAYYKKMSDLFALEELASEVWLLLLEKEEEGAYEGRNDASERTFLISCIQNHMINLVVKEVRERKTLHTVDREDYKGEPFGKELSPEETALVQEMVGNIEARVHKISPKYGVFVYKHMGTLSVRGISNLAAQQGMQLSKSYVHKIIKKIRQEVDKSTHEFVS